VTEAGGSRRLELALLAKQSAFAISLLGLLGALRVLTLPVAAYCSVTRVPVYAPIVIGLLLEPVRSIVSMRCRRRVRRAAMVGFAAELLDAALGARRSSGATRAAFLAERAVSQDIPGLLAGILATAVLLGLGATRLGAALVLSILGVLVTVAILGLVLQRRRRPLHKVLVDALMSLGAWLSVAGHDQGEVRAPKARDGYLQHVAQASDNWSRAESRLERSRLLMRAGLGLLVAVGLLQVLAGGNIAHILHELSSISERFVKSIVDIIVLLSALPSLLLGLRHWDALLGTRSELMALRPVQRRTHSRRQRLERRPEELRVDNLVVKYESELGVQADRLAVNLREPLILVGANGCGKSTLLTTIAGVLEPAQGQVQIDGILAASLHPEQVALVPQEPVLIESLSILDNAQLVVPGVSCADFSACLQALDLRCDVNLPLGNLSRGERRRVAVARALLLKPSLLLLDEPDAWLDAHGRRCLLDCLAQVAHDTAIVIVTHRLELARFGGTIVVLGPNQCVEAVGTIDELSQRSPTFRAVVGG
jgi:ABC-type transport system involved in cytochrome bd biosynthesis fused ATPase/permease subunit